MEDPILKKFGKRLRQLRLEKSLSQEKFAELTGLHRNYIGDVERGERNIGLKNISAIAKALKMPIDELLHF